MVAARVIWIVPTLLLASMISFGLQLIVPGDPSAAMLGDTATEEQLQAAQEVLRLDDPVHVRYVRWLGDVVQGDLGASLFTNFPVRTAIGQRLPVTVGLVGGALALSVLSGLLLGIATGRRRGSAFDRSVTGSVSLALSIPNFWLGLLLMYVFATRLDWFPTQGYVGPTASIVDWIRHMALPVVTLAAGGAADIARQTRSSVGDVLGQDYIRAARAKGLSSTAVVYKHGLKNALAPVATIAGIQISRLFGMSVVVEQVFGLSGVGSLAVDAVFQRDIPTVQGIVLLSAVAVVVTNMIVDLSYLYFNPRTRVR